MYFYGVSNYTILACPRYLLWRLVIGVAIELLKLWRAEALASRLPGLYPRAYNFCRPSTEFTASGRLPIHPHTPSRNSLTLCVFFRLPNTRESPTTATFENDFLATTSRLVEGRCHNGRVRGQDETSPPASTARGLRELREHLVARAGLPVATYDSLPDTARSTNTPTRRRPRAHTPTHHPAEGPQRRQHALSRAARQAHPRDRLPGRIQSLPSPPTGVTLTTTTDASLPLP
jgi:hypothetical protein